MSNCSCNVMLIVLRLDTDGKFDTFSYRSSMWRWLRGRPRTVESVIFEEVQYAMSESMSKAEKLRAAEDSHIGLEMLHLFILDLLGRDSAAAKIFLSKSNEE